MRDNSCYPESNNARKQWEIHILVTSVYLFADGSCLGNPGPGGWAALLRYGNKELLIKGGEADTTNNRMELTAVIEGLKKLKRASTLIICSDSQYMAKAFTEGWMDKWKSNGWRTAQKKPVANQDLWLELDRLLRGHRVSFTWVKGHTGHPENELVDKHARSEAEKIKSLTLKGPEVY